jgi:tRNA 2-selenouridine synthase
MIGSDPRIDPRVGVDAIARHPERIDVRSPAEYALDHIAGAVSHPVLSDAERARVGTMYVQGSPFAAKRVGAALVARNIADMLETAFADKPRDWAPLVYCWRGGQRSRALAHMMNEIGWRAVQLDGGYRAYRRHVVAELGALPARLDYRVICGLTGSGKSRLLGALAAAGAQTLDLEALARHRGSLLGDRPDAPQPSQKAFDSLLWDALSKLDARRAVYVESESRRIGSVQLPQSLLAAMRDAACIRVDTPRPLRVALLKDEYAHLVGDAAALASRLAPLAPLVGHAAVERWNAAAAAGDWDSVVTELLERHYDPSYSRSIAKNFPRHADALVVAPRAVDDAAFRDLARDVLERRPSTAERGEIETERA